jgi:hypothetical protein
MSAALFGADADFTFVFMGDPHPAPAPYASFRAEIDWVRANQPIWNIQSVLSTGDYCQGGDSVPTKLADMWSIWGDRSTGIDSLGIPWLTAIGNHDYEGQFLNPLGVRNSTSFDAQMGHDRQTRRPWFESSFEGVNGKPNMAIRFTVGSHRFLVIALELFPRAEALQWASGVADKYPDHYVIYITHSYQKTNGARSSDADTNYGPARFSLPSSDASGDEMWDNLVKLKPNSLLVLSGHWITGQPAGSVNWRARHGRLTSIGNSGTQVHQLFTNYQEERNAGDGWLTLLKFRPAIGKIEVSQIKTFNCTTGCENPSWPAYELSYSDPAASNQPPAVRAGTYQAIRFPQAATLRGVVTDDGLPADARLSITWSKQSGPGTVIFADATAMMTTATFSQPGTYVLRLTANDTELTAFDDVQVSVRQPVRRSR